MIFYKPFDIIHNKTIKTDEIFTPQDFDIVKEVLEKCLGFYFRMVQMYRLPWRLYKQNVRKPSYCCQQTSVEAF